MHEFDNFIVKQENFDAYVSRQLKRNAYMLDCLGDYMNRTVSDLKIIRKHASMVKTQVEQVLKAQYTLYLKLRKLFACIAQI